MSDSEEEVAFESADEGEGTDNEASPEFRKKAAAKTQSESGYSKPEEEMGDKKVADKTERDNEDHVEETDEVTGETSHQERILVKEKESDSSTTDNTVEPDKPDTIDKNETVKKSEGTEKPKASSQGQLIKPAEKANISKSDDKQEALPESGATKTEEPNKDAKLQSKETEHEEQTPTRKAEHQGGKKTLDKDQESEEKSKILEKLSGAAEKKSGGWSWGGWGSSLLSTATSSVSTFTDAVGEGFSTIVESAEAALGAASPEELAAQQQQEAKEQEEAHSQKCDSADPEQEANTSDRPAAKKVMTDAPPGEDMEGREVELDEVQEDGGQEKGEDDGGWLSWGTQPTAWGISGISNVTHAVQKTSKSLVTGSLDVLETIGKKTYDALAEGDHGLKKAIKKSGDKPNLSQILKEAQDAAKAKAEQDAEFQESRKCHFGAQFDDFQGMVQLEALEMLSNQSEGKLHNLLGSLPAGQLESLKTELVAVKQAFDLAELEFDEDEEKDHDFDRLMTDYIGQLGLNTTGEKLIQVHGKGRRWLSECQEEQDAGTKKPATDIHQTAIQSLAEFTARCVEQFHKIGQLTLLEKGLPVSTFKHKAQNLAEITKVMCTETTILSTKFTTCLNTAADDSEDPESVTPLITNIYLEASNSGTYIQDSLQLLLPVIQLSMVEVTQTQ